ncbi:hypothetical protein SERLA73DRAFT_156349 [Serpula lacrymans var. lacrymans S7.3]|uniref:Uncharacterized protein n=1 Tax=Serpula lacrymans var. lacrymans (strain S7.3) TaxID=936435 RepID=F8QE37_SERL3|nr:hypothetical protein SERLA73DRAFT_156349 [Serpula lacrymans var. lacrymans S7.3]
MEWFEEPLLGYWIQLQMYAKQMNKKGITAEKLELEERCQCLLSHVNAFNLKVERYLGNIDVAEFLKEVPGWPTSNKDDNAENINLFDLPGSFDGLHHLVSQKLMLWEGQTNDALHQICILLGQKSFLFRIKHAIISLGCQAEILQKYQKLKPDHLKTSTQFMNPNATRLRNPALPWFWGIDLKGDTSQQIWMSESKSKSHIQ